MLDIAADTLHEVVSATETHLATLGLDPEHLNEASRALRAHSHVGLDVTEAGVGILHHQHAGEHAPVAVLVRLQRALDLDRAGEPPLRFLWLLTSSQTTHPRLASAVEFSRLMRDPTFDAHMMAAPTPSALLDVYDAAVARKVGMVDQLPGLTPTGRLFGGIQEDLRRRLPWWVEDFRTGLSMKVLSSTLFMYFACLAPAVAFGGLLSELTGGQIGAVEAILASAVCGSLWALFAGQPLAIIGATGPNVIFTGILYGLCTSWDIPFLPTAACTGLWSMLFMWLFAATDASSLIRFFTRFTDEIFAALISLIFVVQALGEVRGAFADPDVPDDTALLTLLLALGTFFVAFGLSRFRRSPYLLPRVREFLSDFGPAIAIVSMTAVALALHRVDLPALPVPATFQPTIDRAWFVNPLDAPRWVWLASAVPALLLTILVWFNQNITARLINSPDNKLLKGPAYHWDVFVMGALLGLMSLFGLPWVVGAVVRSLNHVRSLDRGPEAPVPGVLENRVSNLAIHLLLATSLLFLPLLASIPMAVLFGVFLFMGVGSLGGNQFMDRLRLWLMDPEQYPTNHYLRVVPKRTVHVFTAVQLLALSLLWVVKSSAIGIAFPFFVALLVPVRLALGRVFEAEHIALLDADEVPSDEEFRDVGV